jgi:parallel beta-helix repeat protein
LPLRQVLDRRQISRGTFCVDEPGKRLFICLPGGQDLTVTDHSAPLVEATARATVWDCKGDYIVTKGIRFRYAANRAQEGAAVFAGRGDRVEICRFEETNGAGAGFIGEDIVVRNCTFADNGQLGFNASKAHKLLMSGCTIRGNNAKGFDRGWEAGGDKFTLCRGAVVENCTFSHNHGNGIWFDIGNENCTVQNCLIADNEDAGIFDEISYGLKAHDNVIVGNGLGETPGSWGAAGGISLSSSPNSTIERNLLIGNREGLSLREQNRTTARIDSKAGAAEVPIWNHDEICRLNVLAFNRDAQLRGWFDVKDERNWPAAAQSQKGRTLSLETLHFKLSSNYYGTTALKSGTLFHWGAFWQRNVPFDSLDDVRHTLNLEQDSIAGPVDFADVAARDFRVPADSPLLRAGCYPSGAVQGVRLGILKGD